jgi:hypothetical protein
MLRPTIGALKRFDVGASNFSAARLANREAKGARAMREVNWN